MAKKKTKSPFFKNKNEIIWNIVNALIAGSLVFVGAFADGGITKTGFFIALVASIGVILIKFRDYWTKQEGEYAKIFNFIH